MPVALTAIASYLDSILEVSRFPDDQNGIYRSSSRPVQRIGLAIEPWSSIGEWVKLQRLDALFLHRPWRLALQTFPHDVGILAYHLAFDLTLTFGYNSRLTSVLCMSQVTPFAYKEGNPYGMYGDIPLSTLNDVITTLTNIFGNIPSIETRYIETVQRPAVVAAMTDVLIREATSHSVDLYITGQFRQPALKAVQQTRMNVAIIGHTSGEQWGLRALADILKERWAELSVILPSSPPPPSPLSAPAYS